MWFGLRRTPERRLTRDSNLRDRDEHSDQTHYRHRHSAHDFEGFQRCCGWNGDGAEGSSRHNGGGAEGNSRRRRNDGHSDENFRTVTSYEGVQERTRLWREARVHTDGNDHEFSGSKILHDRQERESERERERERRHVPRHTQVHSESDDAHTPRFQSPDVHMHMHERPITKSSGVRLEYGSGTGAGRRGHSLNQHARHDQEFAEAWRGGGGKKSQSAGDKGAGRHMVTHGVGQDAETENRKPRMNQGREERQSLAGSYYAKHKKQHNSRMEHSQSEAQALWSRSSIAYSASEEGESVAWSRGEIRQVSPRNMPRGQTDADWRNARAQAHTSVHMISNKHGERESDRLGRAESPGAGASPYRGTWLGSGSAGRQEANSSWHTGRGRSWSMPPHKTTPAQSRSAHVSSRDCRSVEQVMPQKRPAGTKTLETRSESGLQQAAAMEKLEMERMSTPSVVESEQTHGGMPVAGDAQPGAQGDGKQAGKADELQTATAQARHWPNR